MQKRIEYDRQTKDWNAYADGEYIGSYKSAHTAECVLDNLAIERAKHDAYVAQLEQLRRAA